jgi:hypothetical protein
VRHPFSGRRLAVATALIAVTLFGGGLVLAPTASASAAPAAHARLAAPAPASASGSTVEPDANGAGCISTLANYGYFTKPRALICTTTATAAYWDPVKALAGCGVAMILTGLWRQDVVQTVCYYAAYG